MATKKYHIILEDERMARIVYGLLLENGQLAELAVQEEEPVTPLQDVLTLAELSLDTVHQTLMIGHDRTISLTGKESELLRVLMAHAGQLVSRSTILQTVWGQDDYFVSRSLSVYINKIRQYLSGTTVSVIGIRSRGYKLVV